MNTKFLNSVGVALALALTSGTAASAGNSFTSYDESLLEVSAAVPGFGGMFYDEEGRLVVRLKNPKAAPAAERVISAVFGPGMIPAKGVVAAPATYGFSVLKALQQNLTSRVLGGEGRGADRCERAVQPGDHRGGGRGGAATAPLRADGSERARVLARG